MRSQTARSSQTRTAAPSTDKSRLHGPAPEMSLAELIHLNPAPKDPGALRVRSCFSVGPMILIALPRSGCLLAYRASDPTCYVSFLVKLLAFLVLLRASPCLASALPVIVVNVPEKSVEGSIRRELSSEVRGRQLGGSRTSPSRHFLRALGLASEAGEAWQWRSCKARRLAPALNIPPDTFRRPQFPAYWSYFNLYWKREDDTALQARFNLANITGLSYAEFEGLLVAQAGHAS